MHPVLFLQEILWLIFSDFDPEPHLGPQSEQGLSRTDLVALATTCRVFKEPALDVLWADLRDPSLPGVCCLKGSDIIHPVRPFLQLPAGTPTDHTQIYTFKRRLKQTERDTVKSYTRRVRTLNVLSLAVRRIDPESFADLCLTSMAGPLFPNIRRLFLAITDRTLPLIHHIAIPKLTWLVLCISVSDVSSCESLVRSLGSGGPNMRKIHIISFPEPFGFGQIMTQQIRCWTQLQAFDCPNIPLDIDTVTYLSHIPGLTELSFTTLTNQITPSNFVLVFPTLRSLQVNAESIITISELFANMLLPAVTRITTFFSNTPPSGNIIKSFSIALQKACSNCKKPMSVSIGQIPTSFDFSHDPATEHSVLTLEDIRPLMALNLTEISIDLD